MKPNYKSISVIVMAILTSILFTQCTQPEKDDVFTPGEGPSIGEWSTSDEVSPDNLVAYWNFDGNIADSKGNVTGGKLNGVGTFVDGRKGQAYKGSANAFISYDNPGTIAGLTSFTVSFWMYTAKHDGGAQGIFALAKADGSFWANFFVIVEGNTSTTNKMQIKLHFEKNATPAIPNTENWVDPAETLRPDNMYGAWRQVTYTYDAQTSKVAMYANGQAIALPAADANRKSGVGDAGLGPLAFKDATKFVIGAFQNSLGAPFNGLEPWMLNYTGMLDEMRIYKTALSSQEVSALYQLERQGR
ncbi:LamG-like jellyroll fold domain-containing protein [Arcticibacter eurypsychrophilus]|uniref:LamG-like jellyroll fold domain-containing protein n=1 Tax=Arcticibacter eurypsychrophilus TaxID=1434752 RepID=UPI00084D12FC|nr:LamG-like jellyroll fold domain-containing protein [Arcticibacter eurypsychrophilus]